MNDAAIEYWFDFASPYSYLSTAHIEVLARSRGLRVLWRPLLLGPVFRAAGWQGSPFLQQPAKLAWMWTDLERQCARHALPWRRPSQFPRSSLLPARIALAYSDGARRAYVGEESLVANLARLAPHRARLSIEFLPPLPDPRRSDRKHLAAEAREAIVRALSDRADAARPWSQQKA